MRLRLALAAAIAAFAIQPAAAQGCGDGQRLFTHDAGETCIPADPQRIVSFDSQWIGAPLHEIGAPVVGSVGYVTEGRNDGRPYMRSLQEIAGLNFGDGGITFIGNWRSPDFEVIAGLTPDLIIILDASIDILDQLSAIAPTVVIAESQPWLDTYRQVADAAGRSDAYEAQLPLYQAELARARAIAAARLGDPANVQLVIAVPTFDEGLWVSREYGAITQVMRDLGFTMPAAVANMEEEWTQFSPELVGEIDADFMLTTYTTFFENDGPDDKRAAFDAILPGWSEFLHAPRNNQHLFFNRERIRAVMFASLQETLQVFLTNVVTRDFVALER
ncbi:MAG: ABC transporter substrate-binding protein [Pseudomonadota bacterium]